MWEVEAEEGAAAVTAGVELEAEAEGEAEVGRGLVLAGNSGTSSVCTDTLFITGLALVIAA